MSTADDNAAAVAAMVREFDFPRYAAALFAPQDRRRAMLALAAFALELSRIPDQVSQPLPGEVRLQWWLDLLQGTAHGGVTGHPVAAELLNALSAHGFDAAPLAVLIEARKFDLYDDPMPSMAALEVYCDDIEGSVIRVQASLFAPATPRDDDVRAAAIALCLTRIVARLPHDAAHRRCLLPADVMAEHGVTRGAVLAGDAQPGLKAARDTLIEAARAHLVRAQAAIRSAPAPRRPAFLPLATLHNELDALVRLPPFAVAAPPSPLRVLTSQWWMRRG